MDRIISQRFEHKSAELIAERVVSLAGGARLRARVRRDGVEAQSYGGVDVWTQAGWSRAITLPLVDLEISQHTPYSTDDIWKEHASNDLDLLEDLGRDFVNVATPLVQPPSLVDKVQRVRERRRFVDLYLESGMSKQEAESLADKVIAFASEERPGGSSL